MKFKSGIIGTVLFLFSCGSPSENLDESPEGTNKVEEVMEDISTSYEPGVEINMTNKNFGTLLVSLETNITWESVSDTWRDRRSGWVMDCQSQTDVKDQAELLKELENTILWSAVSNNWREARNPWVASVDAAHSFAGLGQLLVELENNILWEDVSKDWSKLRKNWLRDCREL